MNPSLLVLALFVALGASACHAPATEEYGLHSVAGIRGDAGNRVTIDDRPSVARVERPQPAGES